MRGEIRVPMSEVGIVEQLFCRGAIAFNVSAYEPGRIHDVDLNGNIQTL